MGTRDGEARSQPTEPRLDTYDPGPPLDGRALPLAAIFIVFVLTPSGLVAQPAASSFDGAIQHLASSIYLGQIYPSGSLYLETFVDRDDRPIGSDPWPDSVYVRPLDAAVALEARSPAESVVASFSGVATDVSPPGAEGFLDPDFPCAPEGYRAQENRSYVGGSTHEAWSSPDYFGTDGWYGCTVEDSVPVYESTGRVERSFRVLASGARVAIEEVVYEFAGAPRPLTAREAAIVAESRRTADCTLEPRHIDRARELLRFRVADMPHELRLSSYIDACIHLHEVFLLDVFAGTELVAQFRVSRWRGNP